MARALLFALFLTSVSAAYAEQAGSVAGVVTSMDGTIVAKRWVAALSADTDPETPALLVRSAETDAAGHYTLRDLPPGRYHIVAGLLERPTYWPGVADPDRASIATVRGSARLDDVSFSLAKPDLLDARALLESSDPVDQAWGGWQAGQASRRELTETLQKALAVRLENPPGQWQLAENAAVDTIADALIQFEAKLPITLLESLYRQRPPQALMLLSNLGPSADGFLLQLLHSQHDLPWFAAANLLLSHKTPGLPAALLQDLSLEADLMFCDPNGDGCTYELAGLTWAGPANHPPVLPTLPPWTSYRLSSKPGKIFALGPKPVYSERWVDTSGGFPTRNDFVSMEPFSGERFRYLVAAVPSIHTPIQISEERTVPCAKRQSLEEERESLLKDIVSRYSALIEKLRLAGALTMGEAHALANPNITFSAYVSKGCSKP